MRKEHEHMKYIIRSYQPFIEKRTRTLIGALKQKREIMAAGSDYCDIIRIPFSRRYPDFPIWFSIISLILVTLFQALD